MRAGATVDVLITASKGTMDDAETAELVDADTREDMFVNDLVIIRAEGSDTKVEAIADVANLDGKIAIGDAKTVPAGKYANQALASVGLYTGTEGDDGEYAPELADKVALADKVGTAASYVSTGDCLAGFVYSSDIFRYDGIEEAFVCPEDSHKPIVYPGAVRHPSILVAETPMRSSQLMMQWATRVTVLGMSATAKMPSKMQQCPPKLKTHSSVMSP